MTTSYVLDETATRLRYDIGVGDALQFRETIRSAEAKKRLKVIWIDRRLADAAWALLERYEDVPLSFTDATTIAVAHARRIREVFAFDDDFDAAGLSVGPA